MRILPLILAALTIPSQAAVNAGFTCGTYRLFGRLQGAPLRLVLWENSPRSLDVRLAPGKGGCPVCEALTGLPVEAKARFTGSKPEGELLAVRARNLSRDLFEGGKAMTLLESCPKR